MESLRTARTRQRTSFVHEPSAWKAYASRWSTAFVRVVTRFCQFGADLREPDLVPGRALDGRPAGQAGVARELLRDVLPAEVEPVRRAPARDTAACDRANAGVRRVRAARHPRQGERHRDRRALDVVAAPEDAALGEGDVLGELELVAELLRGRAPRTRTACAGTRGTAGSLARRRNGLRPLGARSASVRANAELVSRTAAAANRRVAARRVRIRDVSVLDSAGLSLESGRSRSDRSAKRMGGRGLGNREVPPAAIVRPN